MPDVDMIAVDWGTTHFRAYALDINGTILHQHADEFGANRLQQDEFEKHLKQHTQNWCSVETPTIICGMAGSTIGWNNAGYVSCPTSLNEIAKACFHVPGINNTWIVPGLSCTTTRGTPDVMRGEETQLLGWSSINNTTEQSIVILPGTHSKWVIVSDDRIESFATAITGELYTLLSKHSILKFTEEQIDDDNYFIQGLTQAKEHPGLLHQLFSIRALNIHNQLPSAHHSSYLSGLLLGTEIKQMSLLFNDIEITKTAVTLIGNETLILRYQQALELLNIQANLVTAEMTATKGLRMINQQLHL